MADLEIDIDLATSEHSLKVIEEVKKHPVLYDETHKGYTDNELKVEVWEEITKKILGYATPQAVGLVKSRWRNLRWNCKKSFVAYNKKRKYGFNVKTFRYARDMAFLISHYRKDSRFKEVTGQDLDNYMKAIEEETKVASADVFRSASNVTTSELIRAIRKYPILLNDKCRSKEKQNAWKKVEMKLCGKSDRETDQAIKTKWKNIRYRYLGTIEMYKRNLAKGNKKLRVPPYYDELSFMLDHVNNMDLEKNNKTGTEATGGDEWEQEDDDPLLQKCANGKDIQCKTECIDIDEQSTVEATASAGASAGPPEALDQIDGFFMVMGEMVKKMKGSNQALVRKIVLNIIQDMELRELKESQK